ncbi:MAG: Dam-replacing domain protein [Acidobacteriia bacterium]|nr:Dam-replacing domain protein [Terriglobia bacterium]
MLNAVQGIERREFSLPEVYAHEAALARLHPQNRNIRPKIRQQLQILRDLGFVEFLGQGKYRISGLGFGESP